MWAIVGTSARVSTDALSHMHSAELEGEAIVNLSHSEYVSAQLRMQVIAGIQ